MSFCSSDSSRKIVGGLVCHYLGSQAMAKITIPLCPSRHPVTRLTHPACACRPVLSGTHSRMSHGATLSRRVLSSHSNGSDGSRPRVVLAGWLGCQRQHLRRYEDLYRAMGWDVAAVQIAPPYAVMASAIGVRGGSEMWKKALCIGQQGESGWRSMRDTAEEILLRLGRSRGPFVVHVFSNGGAFLWEEIRSLLRGDDGSPATSSSAPPSSPRSLVGVVFDSAPAFYPGAMESLHAVLQHVPDDEGERTDAYRMIEAVRSQTGPEAFEEMLRDSAATYWEGMKSDGFGEGDAAVAAAAAVPQLYLYSEADELARSGPIDDLVRHRRTLCGGDDGLVQAARFRASSHCAHLRKDPVAYRTALEGFLDRCLVRYSRGEGKAADRAEAQEAQSSRSRL